MHDLVFGWIIRIVRLENIFRTLVHPWRCVREPPNLCACVLICVRVRVRSIVSTLLVHSQRLRETELFKRHERNTIRTGTFYLCSNVHTSVGLRICVPKLQATFETQGKLGLVTNRSSLSRARVH